MSLHFAASLLAAQLAAAPAAPPLSPQGETIVIPADWASPTSEAVARRGVPPSDKRRLAVQIARDVIAEEDAEATEVPRRREADTIRGDKYESFAVQFADAKVPGCLRPDGLKRQSTLIFRELLALPFIVVAKVRGKCI